MTWALLAATGRLPIARSVVEISYRDPRVPAPGSRRLSNTHHRVLEVVAEFCERGTGRHCFYSVEQIGERVGVGRRWTQRCLRDLEKFELESVGPVLETLRGGGRLGRDPKTGRMKGRASVYRVATAVLQLLQSYSGRPAALTEQLTAAGRPPLHLDLQRPAGRPNTGRSPDARRARARARDGMRIASPAGSARADFLSSRAPLGPRKGGSANGERDPGGDKVSTARVLAQSTVRCPRCREVLSDPEEHDCAVVYEAPPLTTEVELPPPPDDPRLRAAHDQLLELERSRRNSMHHRREVS
jgi:hypothetical protein